MARFYGTVQGNRGEASRLGHTKEGLTVKAHTWNGRVMTRLYDHNGADWVNIWAEGDRGVWDLYRGPVADLCSHDGLLKFVAGVSAELLRKGVVK